jgi:hypothetical protein
MYTRFLGSEYLERFFSNNEPELSARVRREVRRKLITGKKNY